MVEKRSLANLLPHLILLAGIATVAFPVYLTFVASTHSLQTILRPPLPLLPGPEFFNNYSEALFGGVGRIGGVPVSTLLFNTTVVALGIAVGKIFISILSAYAIVFFRFPFRMTFFWLIFITLMLPVEVRIMPTYKVMVDLGLIDTYTGLTLPLMASATATLLFRQFFLTIPGELVEAARIDGAGPWRFFKDIQLPLSRTNIAALFIQPPVGAWSDRLRTPLGRRMPFILIGAPIGALAFGIIPMAAVLPLFVACTSTLLLSMAFWRTPVVALMPEEPAVGPGVVAPLLQADTAKTAVKEPARAKGAVFFKSWRELLAGIRS